MTHWISRINNALGIEEQRLYCCTKCGYGKFYYPSKVDSPPFCIKCGTFTMSQSRVYQEPAQ